MERRLLGPDSPMTVSYDTPPIVVIRLTGELDLADEAQLQATLDAIPEPASSDLRVDLSAMTFAGVGILSRIAYAAGRFRSARLQSPTPQIDKVLRILDLVDARGNVRTDLQPPPALSRCHSRAGSAPT
jgi:anti-anti-sigma regulatory factor